LRTAIGVRGTDTTDYQIRATLLRNYTSNRWVMSSCIYGATSTNSRFNRPLVSRVIVARQDSVKDAKEQAGKMLGQSAAQFLKVHETRLGVMNTEWVDDSD
jgi:hypothetical protein